MSEKTVKKPELSVGPFGVRINAPAQGNFDKYYYEYEYKEVFKDSGVVDENGDRLGVVETKVIEKKIDIAELINSQADSVGVEAYMKALMVQGVDPAECNTVVSEEINDFSQCPDNLADTMLLGDKAKAAFESLDPALKGNHTTIEGFLNSLDKETLEKYYKSKLAAAAPETVVKDGE